MTRRLGTRGSADWGSYTPDVDGICHDCGRDIGGHAGRGCFAPGARGLPEPRASRDVCPVCGGERRQLIVAPGGFYCLTCQAVGPGPNTELKAGTQLSLDISRSTGQNPPT